MESPIEVLQKRLASGEITVEKYREILNELNGGNTHQVHSKNPPSTNTALLEAGDFVIYDSYLVYKGIKYNISNIQSIGFQAESTSVAGIIPSGSTSLLRLIMNDGTKIALAGTSMLFIGYKNKQIHDAYQLLAERTLSTRYNWYLNILRQNGYIETNGVKITSDGYLIKGAIKVHLAKAAQNKNLLLGTYRSFGLNSESNPYQVIAGERGTGILSDRIIFKVTDDRDVIFPIIKQLARIEAVGE